MPIKPSKASEAADLVQKLGLEEAASVMGISRESASRYARAAGLKSADLKREEAIRRLAARLSDEELSALSNKVVYKEEPIVAHAHKPSRQAFVIGACSDLHLGSKYTDCQQVANMFRRMSKECDMIAIAGDVTSGLKIGRYGSIYEMTHIGADAQKALAKKLFTENIDSSKPVYMIDGNHDRWYMDSAGLRIVKDIARECGKNYFFLGSDEGTVSLSGIEVRLWHGEDANTLSISRRVQDIVDHLQKQDGRPPEILLAGHTHKSLYLPHYNGCHAFSCGSMEHQSGWMRGKKILANVGYWIIKVFTTQSGACVSEIEAKWVSCEQ